MKPKRLTEGQVRKIIDAFLQHIADNWKFYQKHLPHLRRTMMFYNEFAYGIRWLPENAGCAIEFNPKDPLIEDLPEVFGSSHTKTIGNLIYGAWPLRVEFKPWIGYEEPIDDTPQALVEKWPSLFKTEAEAIKHMRGLGTGYGKYKGKLVKLTWGRTPDIWYRGFTTVREFPEQKEFLDSVHNHPRVKLGIQLMEKEFLTMKGKEQRKKLAEAEYSRL